MASALVIFDGSGPLPVTATFDSPSDGDVVFAISGTAWTVTAGNMIGFKLVLDGNVVGTAAMCFANQGSVHMAMRTTFIPFTGLSIGSHTVELEIAYPNTTSDFNDFFQVVLFY